MVADPRTLALWLHWLMLSAEVEYISDSQRLQLIQLAIQHIESGKFVLTPKEESASATTADREAPDFQTHRQIYWAILIWSISRDRSDVCSWILDAARQDYTYELFAKENARRQLIQLAVDAGAKNCYLWLRQRLPDQLAKRNVTVQILAMPFISRPVWAVELCWSRTIWRQTNSDDISTMTARWRSEAVGVHLVLEMIDSFEEEAALSKLSCCTDINVEPEDMTLFSRLLCAGTQPGRIFFEMMNHVPLALFGEPYFWMNLTQSADVQEYLREKIQTWKSSAITHITALIAASQKQSPVHAKLIQDMVDECAWADLCVNMDGQQQPLLAHASIQAIQECIAWFDILYLPPRLRHTTRKNWLAHRKIRPHASSEQMVRSTYRNLLRKTDLQLWLCEVLVVSTREVRSWCDCIVEYCA